MSADRDHHHLDSEDEKRLGALFDLLDVNGDGKIDVGDLQAALHDNSLPYHPHQAHEFVARADQDNSGSINIREFMQYVVDHERRLRLHFGRIDCDRDGRVSAAELSDAFARLGVHVDIDEANRLVKGMDRDGTLTINWSEFRDHMLLAASEDLRSILTYWRHSTGRMDPGESLAVPDDFTEQELRTGAWWRTLLAGGVAGCVSRSATAPLDRLKVLFQVAGTKHGLSIYSGFLYMYREGGIRSMWRGNGINVLKIAPETALKFMAYEQMKHLIHGANSETISASERFVAGSCAGAFAQSCIYPLEVLKTRMALRTTGQYSGLLDCALRVRRSEGVRSFYRGFVPNLVGIVPYAGTDLAIYEALGLVGRLGSDREFGPAHRLRATKSCTFRADQTSLKQLHRDRRDGAEPGVALVLACGTISSSCGQLASYPLALVRTKLQAKAKLRNADRDTMLGVFRTIVREEGVFGLYRGLTANFLKVAPAVSISYAVYEAVSSHLRRGESNGGTSNSAS